MPKLTNPKHEHFAHLLAEGWTAEAAYVEVGYKANRHNASRLKTNETIQARVAELLERAVQRHDVTVESLTRELEEARTEAMKAGNQSAMVSAVMGKAKLHGLEAGPRRNDRSPLEDVSDDDLDRSIERLAAEAGLAGLAGREGPQTTH